MDSGTISAAPLIELIPERIEQQIRALDWRDLQLWSLGLATVCIIAAGFLALIMPQLLWHVSALLSHQENIAQLFFGLIALLVLLNVYLLQQRWMLVRTRRALIYQLQVAERSARTDALTGVYNRRFMEEVLNREVSRADRNEGRKLSLMLADVDGFKDFNTRFGHITADKILVEVAALLQKNFRAADMVVRFGGDEFLVIMPDTDLVQARIAVERLANLLERWNGREHRE